jgi:hypothetical protein
MGSQALLEDVSTDDVVLWLAERILEIERFVGQLPSTAIFVNSEKDVGPIAEALNAALAEDNIPVMACREGQAVGQEGNVRVFDIQHIKGLEFEAVFFISIDQLAAMHPALFDKYLYVGATRAATYLGLTCESQLPARIEELRPTFRQTGVHRPVRSIPPDRSESFRERGRTLEMDEIPNLRWAVEQKLGSLNSACSGMVMSTEAISSRPLVFL